MYTTRDIGAGPIHVGRGPTVQEGAPRFNRKNFIESFLNYSWPAPELSEEPLQPPQDPLQSEPLQVLPEHEPLHPLH
jgi:hypothetical protein